MGGWLLILFHQGGGGTGITVTLTPLLSWFDLTDDLTPVYLEDSLVDSLEIEDGLVVAGGELDD